MANRDAKLIERTLKDFSLGAMSGSGGSVIVDALPAKGVEGTTYLLRKKDESGVFKAHAYALLYANVELPFGNLVFIDADFGALEKSIKTKLDPSLNPDVDFSAISNLASVLEATSITSEEWNHLIEVHNVAIVTKEEDVLNITEDVNIIVQDLGEIGIENLGYVEFKMDGEYLASMYTWLNTLTHRTINQNNKAVDGRRRVEYNSELEPGQTPYSFTEWQEQIGGAVVGTLTDTYEYDRDTLMNLGNHDCYFITLTPEEPTYSYTQYVFDQGVYTVLGGDGSKTYLLQVRYGNTGGGNRLYCSCQVNSQDIKTYADLYNYLLENHYQCYYSSGELDGAILPIVGVLGNFSKVPLGIYADGNGNIEVLSGDSVTSLQNDEDITISYCS